MDNGLAGLSETVVLTLPMALLKCSTVSISKEISVDMQNDSILRSQMEKDEFDVTMNLLKQTVTESSIIMVRPAKPVALNILSIRQQFAMLFNTSDFHFKNHYQLFTGLGYSGLSIVDWNHPFYPEQKPKWVGEMKCGNDLGRFYITRDIQPAQLISDEFVRFNVTMPVASITNTHMTSSSRTLVTSPGGTTITFLNTFSNDLVAELSRYIKTRDGGDEFDMLGFPHPIHAFSKTLMEKGWPLLQMTCQPGFQSETSRNICYITFLCMGKDHALYVNLDYNIQSWKAKAMGQRDFTFTTKGRSLLGDMKVTFIFDNRSLRRVTIPDIPLEFYGFCSWSSDECGMGCNNQRNHAIPNRVRFEKIGNGNSTQLRLRLSCKSCPDSIFKSVACAFPTGYNGVPPMIFSGQVSKTAIDIHTLYCNERIRQIRARESEESNKFIKHMNLSDMDIIRMDHVNPEVVLDSARIKASQVMIVTAPDDDMIILTDDPSSEYTQEVCVTYEVQVIKTIVSKTYKKNNVVVSSAEVKLGIEQKFNKMMDMNAVEAMFVHSPDDKYHLSFDSTFVNSSTFDNGAPSISVDTRTWGNNWGDRLLAIAAGTPGEDDTLTDMDGILYEMKKDKKRMETESDSFIAGSKRAKSQ